MTHFAAVVLFALFASTVFGITQRETPRRMIRYGAYCFVLFVGAAIALIAGAVVLNRKECLSEYLRQSGEGAGNTKSSIQHHDEKMFRDEVSSAKA